MSGDLDSLYLNFLFSEPEYMPSTEQIMSGIKPLVDKTIQDDWRRWKRQWTDYCVIQSATERSAAFQASLLRTAIGQEAMEILDAQPVPTDGSADDVSTLMSMMDTFVMGQVNPTYERYLFCKRMQQPGEPFETFLTDLKTMIKVCEVPASFGDEMLKGSEHFWHPRQISPRATATRERPDFAKMHRHVQGC